MKTFSLTLHLVILAAAALIALPAARSFAQGCPMMGGGDAGCGACGTMVAETVTDTPTALPAKPAVKADDYPLTTCPVTGAKLGAMGKPVIHNYKGREVRFCCSGCIAKFDKEPDKYLKLMDATIIAKEKASYPLTTCVVTGEKLGAMGEGIDYVAKNNHLVRFCCKACIAKFEKDPAPYLKKLADARKAKK
jgi:YHS domain-containing protein